MTYDFTPKSFFCKINKKNMQLLFWDFFANSLQYALKSENWGVFKILKRVLEKWTRKILVHF